MTTTTTQPTPLDLKQSVTLEELYGHLGPINMGAGWAKKTPSLWPEPKRTFRPHRWSYAQAKGALDAAGRLINTELAERRNLILQNPGESYATSRTIVAAYQMIMPGEKARSHRHTPNALRLIIDAEPGAYTGATKRRIGKLDKAVKERVGKAIVKLSEHPELGKRLTGLLSDRWSYRVGDWRILYKVKKHEVVILVLTVGHRSEVYDL